MKRIQNLCSVILLVVFIITASASSAAGSGITGYGCSKNRDLALKYALGDMSSQIQVQVYSELYRAAVQSGDKNNEYISYKVRLTSNLPIYAYHAVYANECVSVSFDMQKAPSAYASRALSLTENINALTDPKPADEPDSAEIARLLQALTYYDEYDNIAVVAKFLRAPIVSPKVNKAEIINKITLMQNVSADIPQIASNILSRIDRKPLYVYPPALYGSMAVTPFASALHRQLSTDKVTPQNAAYLMDCMYAPNSKGNSFILSCQVKDRLGNIMQTVASTVSKEVCKSVSCEPSEGMKALENAAGYPLAGKGSFRGYMYTDFGSDSLILSEGDLVRIYGRVNGEAEIFLMGVDLSADTIYMLPFGNNELILKVNKNDINREIELNTLKVSPPFGSESLVLVAVKGSAAKYLPEYKYNKDKEIFEIKGNAADVLLALRRKLGNATYFESELFFLTKAGN